MDDEARDLAVRRARPADLAGLPALERAADVVFEQYGIWPLPQPTDAALVRAFESAAVVLVAGRPPVGFARVGLVEAGRGAHLDQLSVDPAFARRGVGTALVLGCCEWAVRAGCEEVTLTTFARVPFNAPFYARLGFAVIDDAVLPASLAAMRRREAELGLDALGPRVAMRRVLSAA